MFGSCLVSVQIDYDTIISCLTHNSCWRVHSTHLIFTTEWVRSEYLTPKKEDSKKKPMWANPCLVPDLRGRALRLSPLYDVTCRLSVNSLYQLEKVPLYSYITESFYCGWVLHFVECFCCIYWYDHMVLFLFFFFLTC